MTQPSTSPPLADDRHPRVTAVLRLLPEGSRDAVDRGLRLVLLTFLTGLILPAWRPLRRLDLGRAPGVAAC